MKIKNYFLLLVSMLLFNLLCKAQSNEGWQMATINIHDGTNVVDGIEGYFMLTKCNGTPLVLVKLINHTNYKVKAGWKDLIVTKDEQRLAGTTNAQDSVTIAANGQVSGDCAGNNARLILNLSDFGTDVENFSAFMASDFDFVIMH